MTPEPPGLHAHPHTASHAAAHANEDSLVAVFDALDSLNALIEACKDGEFGCRIGAEHARATVLRQALVTRADAYRDAAEQLRAHVLHLGATPEDGGSTAGAMRRGWMAIRGRLAALDDEAILQDCEAEEDSTQAALREALARPLPAATRGLLEQLQARASASAAPMHRLADALRALA
jgi:uncharacterized protein (TIGR02284 family)